MPQSCHNIYTSQVKTPLNSIKKEFQSSIQSFLAGSPYMSALTKFVNIANTVRPPSLMVIFLLRRQQCQRQQYTPSVANVFYSFSFSWSQSSKRVESSLILIYCLVPMAIILYRFILDLIWSRLFIFEMLTPWSSSARLPLILIDIKAKESIRHRKKASQT